MTDTFATPVTKEKLVSDIKEVIHDADVLLRATAGDLSEKAKEARERLSQRLDVARERLGDLQDTAKEKITVGAKHADETIRSHPYESMAVAFGIGLLVGIVATRR